MSKTPNHPIHEWLHQQTRRQLLRRSGLGIGHAALASLLGGSTNAQGATAEAHPKLSGLPHFAPKAKRAIVLFQHGGPSQLDLFDHKPGLAAMRGQDLPGSIRMGQRLTGMTAYQDKFPTAPSIFKFAQHGKSGAWVSELLPHVAKISDDLCFLKSLNTEQINHDPAVTFFQSGFQLAGRPSIGAWAAYGLGSENQDLPAFVVLISQGRGNAQALADRMWGAGFLPGRYQGVKFRSGRDPVLYLSDPEGYDRTARRRFLDDLEKLNQEKLTEVQDPEISTRISQYEMAFRMQASVPSLTDFSTESEATLAMYGPDVKTPGSYAFNCLLARRMAERGVRFVQLFHRGWDQHGSLPKEIRWQCEQTDQPSAALITDLKQRGLLDETIVLWGGEFGRTVYSQGTLTETNYGRDHHPRCFTMFAAGGGFKPGFSYGETDDYSYNIVKDPMDVHDLHATMLAAMGVDHLRLTHKFQGRNYRLTDVHGRIIREVLT